MSILMDAILIGYPLSKDDRHLITKHNFDDREGIVQSFVPLDNQYAGGTKYASWDVFQACFNKIDMYAVVEWFEGLPLQDRNLVLILDHESDEAPSIFWSQGVGRNDGEMWKLPYVAPQRVAIQAAYQGIVLFGNGAMMDIAQIEKLLTDNDLLPAAGVQDLGNINQPVHAEYDHKPEETGIVTVCGRTDGRSWSHQLLEEVNCPDCLRVIQEIAPQLMQPPAPAELESAEDYTF